jgi:Na+/proline symporter
VQADKEFNATRKAATDFVKTETKNASFNDVNYVFPTFVIQNMPIGVIGLIIAAIFAAAMSSISAELNSLATATTIDFYKRHFAKDATEKQYVRFGRIATLIWGIFACLVATQATSLGSLIEVVNKFGSFFYGSLLGVFVLAFAVRRARARGAFWGLLIGILCVYLTSLFHFKGDLYYISLPWLGADWSNLFLSTPGFSRLSADPGGKPVIEFLWLNLVGAVATVVAGYLISLTVSAENDSTMNEENNAATD